MSHRPGSRLRKTERQTGVAVQVSKLSDMKLLSNNNQTLRTEPELLPSVEFRSSGNL